MSAKNGDKARYGRLRKQKLAKRLKNASLKKELETPKPTT
jgi:hypothetical protein